MNVEYQQNGGGGCKPQGMLKGTGRVTELFFTPSSKKEGLRCSQRVVPQTHEPSVKTVRCLCAVAPGPTVRPLASASPQSFSTDAARQANFLRCQSDDIFQVKSCTFFRAPDHGTHTRTRIFARASRHFVKIDGKDIHAQTLTSHAILVNRIDGLVGCFPKWPCWTVERRHPHELADMLEAGKADATVPNALDVAARVRTRSADQHGQCVTSLAQSLAIGP